MITRDTKQKKIIYDSVVNRCDHPSAEQIYEDVSKTNPHISKATVYRNLKTMSEEGCILHVKVPGADRYDLTTKNHYHIICTVCGKVADSPFEYEKEKDMAAEIKSGFKIKKHSTVFEGICPECQKKQS